MAEQSCLTNTAISSKVKSQEALLMQSNISRGCVDPHLSARCSDEHLSNFHQKTTLTIPNAYNLHAPLQEIFFDVSIANGATVGSRAVFLTI